MTAAARPARRALHAACCTLLALAALAACTPPASVAPAGTGAPPPRAAGGELPRTHAPRPTTPPITAADLMTRLYILADDSMMGREAGTRGNVMATDYVAAEFRRLGLEPAGEGGTFFQTIPLTTRGLEPGAALSVDGAALTPGRDFQPVPFYQEVWPFGPELRASGAQAVYGGRLGGQLLPPAQAAGKVVVFAPPIENGRPDPRFWADRPNLEDYAGAAAIVVATLDITDAGILEFMRDEQTSLGAGDAPGGGSGAPGIIVTNAVAERMLGAPLAGLSPGAAGRPVSGAFRFSARPAAHPARNVVAVLRGSDASVNRQYVAIGAHNDHDGVMDHAVDHDSVRAFNRVMRPQGANDRPGAPTAAQQARIDALRDSLRALRPPRPDSILNGADDDGSGTAVLLEIAEALARAPQRPRRSILFVSHTAEEKGLFGSEHFTDHPTVPRDSIVAALNMDMVGRGRAEDVARGAPNSLQIIGSRRLSTGLGDLIDRLNATGAPGERMRIDYSFDAPGHPLNRYCRSDHYMYARYGIPITYFSLGYHIDYHQVSDEPQYIDYDHSALVGSFVHDVAVGVANLDHRLVVDKPKPDPNAPCRQ